MDSEFESPHYIRCDDPECPDGFAFRHPFPSLPHWHFTGSEYHSNDSVA